MDTKNVIAAVLKWLIICGIALGVFILVALVLKHYAII